MTFIEYDKKLSAFMGKLESKLIKQSLRVSLNKALGASMKEAKKEVTSNYDLPLKGNTDNRRFRPSLPTQLIKENIRGIGGIDQKIPAKIKANDKPLSLIRFLSAKDQSPQKQKGLKVKDRKKVSFRLGKNGKQTVFKRRFIAIKHGKAHVFRRTRIKGGRSPPREKLSLERLASVFKLISKPNVQKRMEKAAKDKMAEVFEKELEKRIKKNL